MIKRLISRFYNQSIEDVCTRVLYFFNTIDTYFIVAGALSFAILDAGNYGIFVFLIITIAVFLTFKTADFYPLFLIFSPLFLFFLFKSPFLSLSDGGSIFFINLMLFVLIQFLFMGIPDSIVARDATIGFRKIYQSIFTIAPTTVSLSMSVYFSTLYALILIARPNPAQGNGFAFWAILWIAAFITRAFKPRSFISSDFKPEIKGRICERVVLLNIDGCRLDRFFEAQLPFLTSLQKESSYFPGGIQTVYRALTNPAFASILTGTIPEIHGIKSNNLRQTITVEALPDVVKTKLYGSMHIKHFSKPCWDTKVVSLPTHSVYKSDAIMFDWLKEDLKKKDGTRLFIADISETDFLGHAYGSESVQYLDALKRADRRIEDFFLWFKKENILDETIVIVCSDHGIIRIDHSYLLFDAEKYVPFMISGDNIKANNPLKFKASIMDIAPTISYLLGVKYPNRSQGRVFIEAISSRISSKKYGMGDGGVCKEDATQFRVITTNDELKQAWGDPLKTTEVQAKILAKKGLLLSWYRKIYKYMAKNLSKETVTIEIGSGSSKLYEHIGGLIRSNIIFIKDNDITFSAYQIPFRNNSVGNIILIDVLHHLHDPYTFFQDAQRALTPGGRILICDPYLSLLSSLIWQYLHLENCDRNHLGFNNRGKINPLIDANSANATILFFLDKDSLSKTCPQLTVKKTDLHSKFHYWIAGGYNFPQFLPTAFAPLVDFTERMLSPFDKWLASFMFVIIEKKKENCV